MIQYHFFETPLGRMAVAWSERGVTRVQIPERDRAAGERRLLRLVPGGRAAEALPPAIAEAVCLLRAYAAGAAADLSGIALDLPAEAGPFCLAVWQAARRLAPGETVTYGTLAERAGYPGQARDAGQALGRNPVPIVVPCHRVVAAGGRIGGFSAPGGSRTKERLLALEGVRLGPAQAALL